MIELHSHMLGLQDRFLSFLGVTIKIHELIPPQQQFTDNAFSSDLNLTYCSSD